MAANDQVKTALLNSGEFGGRPPRTSRNHFRLLHTREETGFFARKDRIDVLQHRIPNSKGVNVDKHRARVYCGQYSNDGGLFFSACQDWKIKFYDTTTPLRPRHIKTIPAHQGQWTLTDCQLTTDKKFMIYSSITPFVYLTNLTGDALDPSSSNAAVHQEKLDFSKGGAQGGNDADDEDISGQRFGLWSIRFSGDDREVVAGASDNALYVFDIETKNVTFRARAHTNHVNAVAFANASNSNLVFSGGDDALIYVWDRRSFSSGKGKPEGMFVGHNEGLTYISSKGDGVYLLSNCKDQTMKLWDMRSSLVPYNKQTKVTTLDYWDYRMAYYPSNPADVRRKDDTSTLTMCGHYCLQTLIRCGFAPESQTGQRYMYCGSFDGQVYIYDLAGRIVQKLGSANNSIVRDVSWHPDLPVITATSWNGSMTLFTYDDDIRLEKLESKDQAAKPPADHD